jgi:hypothetical protein
MTTKTEWQVQQAEKGRRAIELARDGKSIPDAAAAMNMSQAGYLSLLKRTLHQNAVADAQQYRAIHLERLELMFASLVPKIKKGDAYAVKVAVEVLKRQAELLGLDAPVQVNIRRLSVEYAEKYGLTAEERKELFVRIKDELHTASGRSDPLDAIDVSSQALG